MNRSPDILFMAEYIKNVLYFATVREGKIPKSNADTHYFCIDNELVYENYYSDFGPLNLGCVYKYCEILNDKLKQYLNQRKIVHYTSADPKKKSNSAFVLGCYGVLYLSLQPRDALRPLMVHGQSYRPFQDATQGNSSFTISLLDCLQAIMKAKEMGFFNFQDFNYEEYESLDKLQGGDLNWIVPGKFLAFIGPVDYSVSLHHPPEIYIDYFLENNVKIVIRLNKRLYDSKVFSNAGINHYDLFFSDGSCPPRHILMKFLQISEEADGAIAVHCKAGLGRTGSLIGCYLMKHYRMTSHEAIGWMRICRPGSVIGHQQAWLEQLEVWLMKQGNLYRKRAFNNTDKFPYHKFGVYSIQEKTLQQRPVMFEKSPSPSRLVSQQTYSGVQPQTSRLKEDKTNNEEDEVFLTSCDLTIKPTIPLTQLKGCIIKNNTISEEFDESSNYLQDKKEIPLWKQILCCQPCMDTLKDAIWAFSVRCARVAPETNRFCSFMDMVATNTTKKEPIDQWRVRPTRMSSQNDTKGRGSIGASSILARRGSGGGEPRPVKSLSKSSARASQVEQKHNNSIQQKTSVKSNDSNNRNMAYASGPAITTFRTSNGPIIRSVNDARNFLLKSSMYNGARERQLMSSVIVTPQSHSPSRLPNFTSVGHASPPPYLTPTAFSTAPKSSMVPQQRRRLGRSPSPQQTLVSTEKTRATNTPPPSRELSLVKGESRVLKEVLSRVKLSAPRERSIGTASLGARRDAPVPKQAPSVRSDERPLATQGDLLNSIKFQRRLRNTLHTDKFHEKLSNVNSKDKSFCKNPNSRITMGARGGSGCQDPSNLCPRDKSYIIKNVNSRSNTGPRDGGQDFSNANSKDKSFIKKSNSRTNMLARGGPDFSSSNSKDKSFVKNMLARGGPDFSISNSKDKSFAKNTNSRTNTEARGGGQDFSSSNSNDKSFIKNPNLRTNIGARGASELNTKEKPNSASKSLFGPTRPSSPKGRRSPHSPSYYN